MRVEEVLERPSSGGNDKGCSELLQAFAGVRGQGWRMLRTFLFDTFETRSGSNSIGKVV